MVHAWRVFVAGIHPSRTGMSGSFKSVRWNVCVHRLDLSLYSHPQEFWGNGVRTHVNSKGKILSATSSEEDRTHDAASRRPASPRHNRLSYSGPPFQCMWLVDCVHAPSFRLVHLVGLVVKASPSRAEDPGLESRLRRDIFGVESYQ